MTAPTVGIAGLGSAARRSCAAFGLSGANAARRSPPIGHLVCTPILRERAMSHHYDNVRRLLRRQVSRPRWYKRPVKVLPLTPHLHDPRHWHAVGFFFLAIAATAILIAWVLVLALRSGNDLLAHLVPGWPWW